jgi:hypothetical protein
MPCEKKDAAGERPVRQRNLGCRARCYRGSDTGDYFARDTRCRQGEDFFAAASEDERIAAFEPDNAPPSARFFYEQGIDLLLSGTVGATAFPGENQFCARSAFGEQFFPGEAVIDYNFCFAQAFQPAHRYQVWRTRPRAYKGDAGGRGRGCLLAGIVHQDFCPVCPFHGNSPGFAKPASFRLLMVNVDLFTIFYNSLPFPSTTLLKEI